MLLLIFAALNELYMISVNQIAVEYSGEALFSDVSFVINENDKIALMGKNGAGKSTMMKIIAGVQKATRGNVRSPKETVIAYLPQHLLTEDNCTVFEEAAKAFAHVFEMRDEMNRLNKELETRTDFDSDEYMKIIEKVSDLGEKYYALEDVNYDAEVEKALGGLGFKREDFTRHTNEFSGGWRMRIELVKILLQKPDLILLDEPTNHVDIESVIWLEDFLLNKAKAVVVISHDKAFIDSITNRTIEVTMGRIYDYKANYSHYLTLREERREHQIKAFKEQQKFITDTKTFIDKFKAYTDKKELAEHLMLLDLGRNDIGRVAKVGTVKPTEKFIIERYSHVMHIVSNVVGELRNDQDAVSAFFAGMPAGTVSGAPKVRAMEIIDELEPEKRGVYGGGVGYFSSGGDMDMCIALRTAVLKDDTLYIQAGGGIVFDSDAEAEYMETVHKSNAIRKAAADAAMFEE